MQRMFTKLLRLVLALALAAPVLLPTAVAHADSTVVVYPADVGVNWFTNDTRTGGSSSFVAGPVPAPLGMGSLQTTTDDDIAGSSQAKAQLFTYQYIGVQLDDISALSYWAYRSSSSTNSDAQTISLNLEVDYVGDGLSYTTLVFEPVYNPAQQAMAEDTWQQWDAFDGGNAVWWSTKDIPGVCAFNCFVSWSTILTNNPNAKIKYGVGFNVGSGWVGQFSGNADALTIGVSGDNTTFDFEPDLAGPVTSDVVATPNPALVNQSIALTALVDDSSTGGSTVVSAEYKLGDGSWTAMAAQDGSFDSVSEAVTAGFSALDTPGVYPLCVRGTDAAGSTGAESCILFVVTDAGFITGGGWINSPAGAYSQMAWDQGFETNTDGWFDGTNGWYGSITQVASGSGGINSASGSWHAVVAGDVDSAPFSRFDGYRDTWTGTWTAEIDVYLDPSWLAGTGFDYSVAATGSDGNHQRDYIFHVTKDTTTGKLLVAGSNNTNFAPREDLETINHYEVPTAGWYTLQHVFYEQSGALAVDLNLLDANGTILFTETRFTAADTIPAEVGGNRYAWFTFVNVLGGIAVDNHQLFVSSALTGKATFGFVAKYNKKTKLPEGTTEFVFQAAGLNFHSDVYDWLVVNQAGSNAQFKGSGLINGAEAPSGNDYRFMLWATDGDAQGNPDTFRIKIWWEDHGNEVVVYDNGVEQALGGGSIVIHDDKGKASASSVNSSNLPSGHALHLPIIVGQNH